MTFEDWWRKQNLWHCYKDAAQQAWDASQQAERERIRRIVEQIGVEGNHDEWFDCCDTIIERIG